MHFCANHCWWSVQGLNGKFLDLSWWSWFVHGVVNGKHILYLDIFNDPSYSNKAPKPMHAWITAAEIGVKRSPSVVKGKESLWFRLRCRYLTIYLLHSLIGFIPKSPTPSKVTWPHQRSPDPLKGHLTPLKITSPPQRSPEPLDSLTSASGCRTAEWRRNFIRW